MPGASISATLGAPTSSPWRRKHAVSEILCEHKASPAKLDILGVFDWPTWEKEPSSFDWHYDRQEVCYVLRGKFTVTPEGGEPLQFGRGDLITFPAGLSCRWEVQATVEKHYAFS